MTITQIHATPTNKYPWTHRVGLETNTHYEVIKEWCEKNKIPGVAVMGAFYTTKEGAITLALRWQE